MKLSIIPSQNIWICITINDHSAFHWLNAQAHCLPSLPKLLPEAQLEIIKRDEGALAVWRSRSVSLLPSLSICHAAAGSRPLCSQLSAQLEIIPLSLSANSRHVAVNITPPPLSLPLLLHPFSHLSVPWIKWRLAPIARKIRFFRWWHRLIWPTSLCRAQGMTGEKKLQVSFCVITFPGNRGTFFLKRYVQSTLQYVALLLPDWKTNGPRCWW